MTTDEIDGLLTDEESTQRNTVMIQCRLCDEWVLIEGWSFFGEHKDCPYCGGNDYNASTAKSPRTFRRPTKKRRR